MINKLKQYLYQRFLVVEYDVRFKNNVNVNRNVHFEGGNSIYNNSSFIDSKLGYGSYIANNSVIRNTKIGRFCAIGDYVRTGMGMHPTKGFVSIHPAFFSSQKQAGFTFADEQLFEEHRYIDDEKKYFVEIGNDVWIGNNVNIIDGTTIGDGAVIAAGAVVTKDVEPYAILGGIPAKHIKYRFDEETREKLLKIKWWNRDIKWLKQNWRDFNDIDKFIKNIT